MRTLHRGTRLKQFDTSYSILKPFTLVVGVAGFEPTTSWTPFKRASQAALHPDEFHNYSIFLSIINLNPKLKYFDIDFIF